MVVFCGCFNYSQFTAEQFIPVATIGIMDNHAREMHTGHITQLITYFFRFTRVRYKFEWVLFHPQSDHLGKNIMFRVETPSYYTRRYSRRYGSHRKKPEPTYLEAIYEVSLLDLLKIKFVF